MTDETRVSLTRYGLVAAAFLTVIGILAVTVFKAVESEYAQGILTLVLGRMLGYVDGIYSYEFGTTRSSAKKDHTIGELTKTAATVATTAQATQVAADVAATAGGATAGPQQPSTLKVEDVAIVADNVHVDKRP